MGGYGIKRSIKGRKNKYVNTQIQLKAMMQPLPSVAYMQHYMLKVITAEKNYCNVHYGLIFHHTAPHYSISYWEILIIIKWRYYVILFPGNKQPIQSNIYRSMCRFIWLFSNLAQRELMVNDLLGILTLLMVDEKNSMYDLFLSSQTMQVLYLKRKHSTSKKCGINMIKSNKNFQKLSSSTRKSYTRRTSVLKIFIYTPDSWMK